MVFLEDLLRGDVGRLAGGDARRGAAAARAALERLFVSPAGPRCARPTIIFSSGSTGVPKGVMLTHRNVLANIDAATELFRLTPDDVVLGVLPFFHSFGFTVHALVAAGRRLRRRLPSEPDGRQDHRRARRALQGARMLISTPTFCAPYVRKMPARAVRAAAARDRRRGTAARADRRGVQGASSASS